MEIITYSLRAGEKNSDQYYQDGQAAGLAGSHGRVPSGSGAPASLARRVLFTGRKRVEYHLNMMGAEIKNRAFRADFAAHPHKVVLEADSQQ